MEDVVFWGNDTRWSTINSTADSVIIRGSTFAGNKVWWEYPFIRTSEDLSIEDCILAYNTSSELIDATDPITTHSCVFGNTAGDSLVGLHYENLFTAPLFCGQGYGDLTLHDDSPCLPGGNPWGVLMGANGAGGCGTGVDEQEVAATSAHIRRICPNPSNAPGSLMSLAGIPEIGAVLSIYDLRGGLVRRLTVERTSSGTADCLWDLKDEQGERVSSGVYFAVLSCSGAAVDRAKLAVVR
jgi:hypothetical protein